MSRRAKFTFVALAVLAVLAGAYILTAWFAERQYEAAVARLSEPARIELYRALATEPGSDARRWPDLNPKDLARARETLATWNALFTEVSAIAATAEWQTTRRIPVAVPEFLTKEQKDLLDALVTAHAGVIGEIRAAATGGGPAVLLDYAQQRDMPFSELSMCDWLLRVDAFQAISHVEMERAADDLIASVQLANVMLEEPFRLPQSFGTSTYTGVYRLLSSEVPPASLPVESERELVELMGLGVHREGFAESIAGEAASNVYFWEHPPPASTFDFGHPTIYLYGTYLTVPPLRHLNLSALVDLAVEFQNAAALPHWEGAALARKILQRAQALSAIHVVARQFAAAIAYAFADRAEHETRIQLARAGLVVERYHAGHGEYPDSLQAIASLFPADLPADPYTGSPLRYRIAGDSFVLYSVGSNLTDDGGQHDFHDGDIVWRGESDDGAVEIDEWVFKLDGVTFEIGP